VWVNLSHDTFYVVVTGLQMLHSVLSVFLYFLYWLHYHSYYFSGCAYAISLICLCAVTFKGHLVTPARSWLWQSYTLWKFVISCHGKLSQTYMNFTKIVIFSNFPFLQKAPIWHFNCRNWVLVKPTYHLGIFFSK